MNRIDKVNQAMRREISLIIQHEVKDPRLEMVTITHVEVSRDLQQSKVYFSVLGNEERVALALEGLMSAKGFIRRLLGHRIKMRFTPDIAFVFDASIEYGARIEATIEKLHQKSQPEEDSP